MKPAVVKIQVEAAKYLTKLGIKINIAAGILLIINHLAKASGLLDNLFPFGLSIGGVVALALSKVFSTYTKYERKWGWFGQYAHYTNIKFW